MALLEGAILLAEGGRPETMGVLVRALFETWLVANYVLLKGKDADDESVLIELGNDFARSVTAMAAGTGRNREDVKAKVDAWKMETRDHPDNVAGPPELTGMRGNRLNLEQVASAVRHLLAARAEPSLDAVELYNAVYRGESTYSAHPGLGALHMYMDYDEIAEESDRLTLRPKPPFPNQARVGALLTLDLALRLLKEFGFVEDGSIAAAYEEMANEARESRASEVM
jgi:hypothetical protein